jgi:hypothetical protein
VNFLFTTVLVLLLVAPGLFFSKAYFSGSFNIRFSKLTVTDQVFYALIPTLFFHLLLVLAGTSINLFYVDFKVLGVLLMGAKEDATIEKAFSAIQQDLGNILLYQATAILLAIILGWGLRYFVKRNKIDKTVEFFKYDNYWYYLLTGEILEFSNDSDSGDSSIDASEIEFIFLDILVASKDKNLLYSGLFYDYQLAADGGLDCLFLKSARRKFINTDPRVKKENSNSVLNDQPRKSLFSRFSSRDKVVSILETYNNYYPVDGDILVIPFKEIINVNLSYYLQISEDSSSTSVEEVKVNVEE